MKKMYKINGNPENFADLQVFHKLAKQFIPYAQKKMGFDRPVGINLISDPENAKNPLGKTAHYDPNKLEVTVFVDKRHVKDILRSLSHELVHHTQNCRGDLENRPTGPGYAQEDAHMRDMEREAYERGQLALRDFEDNLKNKENQKMNEQKDQNNDGMNDFQDVKIARMLASGMSLEQIKKEHPDLFKRQKQQEGSCTEAEIAEGSCMEESINEEQDDQEPKDRGARGEDKGAGVGDKPPEGSRRTAPGEGQGEEEKVTNENWTRKNKNELLFERLVKKWTK